jgi:hypothetical protein
VGYSIEPAGREIFMGAEIVHETVLELLSARNGHFLLESGHHGDLWLDLESRLSSTCAGRCCRTR